MIWCGVAVCVCVYAHAWVEKNWQIGFISSFSSSCKFPNIEYFSESPPYSSVQFSHSLVSDSLRPRESQNARPPCPSQTPGVHSNSCPSGGWCHPAISSSVIPFSSCPQPLPASGSFLMSQFFTSGGQSIRAFASVLLMNIQGWFPLDWLVWSPCSPRDSQESSIFLLHVIF